MHNHLSTIFHSARRIRLTAAARSRIRAKLEARMAEMPPQRPIPSPYLHLVLSPQRMMSLALMAVLVFGGSGIALASEGSLPGDALYAIKVGVTEPARGVFAIGTEAEAEWETMRAERRLEETEALAAANDLDTDTGAALEARFLDSAAEAEEHLAKLAEQEPEAAARQNTEFEAMLAAHERILGDIASARRDAEPAVAPILAHVALRYEKREETRQALSGRLEENEEEDAKDALADAARHAKQATRSFASSRVAEDTDAEGQIAARISVIEEELAEGEANYELGNYREAYERAERARSIIGVSERLVKAKERYEWRGQRSFSQDWGVQRYKGEAPQPARMGKAPAEDTAPEMSMTMSLTTDMATSSEGAELAQDSEEGADERADEEEEEPEPDIRIDLGL